MVTIQQKALPSKLTCGSESIDYNIIYLHVGAQATDFADW